MEGQWRRTHNAISRAEAFAAVDGGAPWIFLWCGGGKASPSTNDGGYALSYAKSLLVDPDERERLFAKGKRKGEMPTVVMAERWQDESGDPLVLFYESGPYLRPDREQPDRQ